MTKKTKPRLRCRFGRHQWYYLTSEEIDNLHILEVHHRRCRDCGRRDYYMQGPGMLLSGWSALDETEVSREIAEQKELFETERCSEEKAFFLVDQVYGATVDSGDASFIRAEIGKLDPFERSELLVINYVDGQRSGSVLSAEDFLDGSRS